MANIHKCSLPLTARSNPLLPTPSNTWVQTNGVRIEINYRQNSNQNSEVMNLNSTGRIWWPLDLVTPTPVTVS